MCYIYRHLYVRLHVCMVFKVTLIQKKNYKILVLKIYFGFDISFICVAMVVLTLGKHTYKHTPTHTFITKYRLHSIFHSSPVIRIFVVYNGIVVFCLILCVCILKCCIFCSSWSSCYPSFQYQCFFTVFLYVILPDLPPVELCLSCCWLTDNFFFFFFQENTQK